MAKSSSAQTSKKQQIVHVDLHGQAYITATFNNLLVTFTNKLGQVVCWSTAGKMGFKGSKKSTPYAAQVTSQDATKAAITLGMKKCDVFVNGPGSGRESAIRAIAVNGIEINTIKDITAFPHNGCRPPKKRRV